MTPLMNKSVTVGQRAKFQCELEGDAYPTPSVEWMKDGEQLVVDRAFFSVSDKKVLLRIQDVKVEDEGEYTCYLTNKSGTDKSSAKLTVMSKCLSVYILW